MGSSERVRGVKRNEISDMRLPRRQIEGDNIVPMGRMFVGMPAQSADPLLPTILAGAEAANEGTLDFHAEKNKMRLGLKKVTSRDR
jgi:hypothetical protein